jgi:altronate dehydratase large subunit
MATNHKYRWEGYLRQDGSKGIRNKVLVIYTVECASFVAKVVGAEFSEDDVDVVGFTGCTDNEYAIRMLLALIRHPNVGAVVPIGLGCEYIQAARLADKAREAGKLSASLLIQECGGTRKTIEAGYRIVRDFVEQIQSRLRWDWPT